MCQKLTRNRSEPKQLESKQPSERTKMQRERWVRSGRVEVHPAFRVR